MKERKAELIVGLVVTAGVLLLVLGVVWGKKASFFSDWSVRRIRFEDVRGLESGDPVMVRGISQGAVDDIRLQPGWVEVKIRIRKSVRGQKHDGRKTGLGRPGEQRYTAG
jgi:ABC-type transporter Mla subunit MlaD